MIYLATPYSDPDLATRNWRFQRARQALFHLWEQHQAATCPIVLGHEYEQRQRGGPRTLPHSFWMQMARVQLISCTNVYVLTLPGWDKSVGVRDECRLAVDCGRPIQGYAAFDSCQDVSGRFILQTFGIETPRKLMPLQMMRTTRGNPDEDSETT